MRANKWDASELLRLPYTLDTLQCFLLAQIGFRTPSAEKVRRKIFLLLCRLVPLLGLHRNQSTSPLWLDKMLAVQLENLISYNSNASQGF